MDVILTIPIAFFALLASPLVSMTGLDRLPTVSPLAFTIGYARAVARRLDKAGRGASTLVIRGLIGLLIVVLPLIGLGFAIETVPSPLFKGILSLTFLALSLDTGMALRPIMNAARYLETGHIVSLRNDMAPLQKRLLFSRENLNRDDAITLLRLLRDQWAMAFVKGMVSPILWYLIFGLPGLMLSVASRGTIRGFTDSGLAGSGFRIAARGFDRAIALIPAGLGAWLLVLATAFTPGTSFTGSIRGLALGETYVKDSNAAWPVGAVTGATKQAFNTGSLAAARTLRMLALLSLVLLVLILALIFLYGLMGRQTLPAYGI